MKVLKGNMTTRIRRPRLAAVTSLAIAGVLALAGCGSDSTPSSDPTSDSPAPTENTTEPVDEQEWPRTFTNADGTTTEIPTKPERVFSTSVSVTGTLLAIDAPVVASGSAGNGAFFAQWADVADERDVENAWAAGAADPEAVIAAQPDLIIVSTSGADSEVDLIDEFSRTAPVIVVDYGGQTWQELAQELGEALGIEDQAQSVLDDFDTKVADVAANITVPEGTANIISFNGPGEDNPIARLGGPHADILTALGFEVEDPDVEWHVQDNVRNDFVWAPYEKLVELTSETTFILSADDETAQGFADDPVLANVPSVQAGQVYGLGANSFRIDYFSANEIVDAIAENFGG